MLGGAPCVYHPTATASRDLWLLRCAITETLSCIQSSQGVLSVLQDENLSDMLIQGNVLVTEGGKKEAVGLSASSIAICCVLNAGDTRERYCPAFQGVQPTRRGNRHAVKDHEDFCPRTVYQQISMQFSLSF